jgi:hypothetical protein
MANASTSGRNSEMKGLLSATALVALAAGPTFLPAAPAAPPYPIINPDELQWVPKDALPPGAHGAIVRGDPHAGPYAFFGRFPANFTVPSHWHTNDVAVVMTEGSMEITTGISSRRIEQGGYFFLPGEMRYIARCDKPCKFLAWGEKPFEIHYEHREDDPRIRSGR